MKKTILVIAAALLAGQVTAQDHQLRTGDDGPVTVGNRSARAADATRSVAGMVAADSESEHDPYTLTLLDGRFTVKVGVGSPGGARVVPVDLPGDESGLFYFFNEENAEMLVKVLNGCAVNGYVWVYAASATDMGFSIDVTETETGSTKRYSQEDGEPARALTDSGAFPCR